MANSPLLLAELSFRLHTQQPKIECPRPFCSDSVAHAKARRDKKVNKFENSTCTSLVNYGSNLGSTLGTGRLPNNIQNLISLTPTVYSIIVGLLLSDG